MCEVGEITRQCGAATPGIARTYAADVADIVSIPLPGSNYTISGDIILKPGKYWKDIPFVEQKAGLEDDIADAVGGGFRKSIPLKLSKYSPQTNRWVNNAIGARFVVVVADNNGQMILVGDKVAPMRLERAKGQTGQKFGDENGWDMNFVAEGLKPCYFYTGAIPLQLVEELSISTQPAPQTLSAGGTISLSVVATGGTAPYTYQLRKNGAAVSGATSATYTKSNAVSGDAGNYDFLITDAAGGTITSDAVVVVVNAVTTFDTTLTLTSSHTASAAGVTITGGNPGFTDPNLKLRFNAIPGASELPGSMSCTVGGGEHLTTDFMGEYAGQQFEFTDKAGVVHTGVFTDPVVAY